MGNYGSNKAAQLAAPKQSSSAAANLNSTPAQQKQGSPARQQPSNPARQQQSSLSARRHAPSKFVMKLVEEDASNQHNMMMVSPNLQQASKFTNRTILTRQDELELDGSDKHSPSSNPRAKSLQSAAREQRPMVPMTEKGDGSLRAEAFNRPRSITEPFGGLKNLPIKLSMRSELQEHELRAAEFKSTSYRAQTQAAERSNTYCQGQPRAAEAEHEVQNLNTRCRGRA
ncbi:hypothetical protein SLEP1_g13224 [Rubroshorea leprosula]|uniref:Uncharacterized protein n=1 Tax=Rubroshorea leprosula TaxID=152421 RepID=A0AAV5IQI0_9ROSI|nr:hypothetical protein SLEP1_g13224 [Rubroshorea leprosula]